MGRASGGSETIYGQTNQIYSMSYTYDLAGHVKTMTYPSNRTVTNTYDNAGRLQSLTGTLGDGATRNYSSGISYDAGSRMTREQFGTQTAIYNKLFYNVRGQLAEIREGLTPNDTTWERGAIINHYSNNCWGMCGGSNSTTAMSDNDGNLKMQQHWIPDANGNTAGVFQQQYDYDSLNRLWRVSDDRNYPSWRQQYSYDRWGNRTIDQGNTWNTGVPTWNFGVDTSTNRLTPPGGSTMNYDAAGNLTYDNYTGQGTRTYDAENRMITANGATDVYTYDGDGHRVKRKIGNTETWQIYGVGGELIAEYAANANPATTSPQKEYGYRNGQLLITATVTAGSGGSPYSFTDNPVVAGLTTVQALHLNELRTAVNQARAHAGLSAANWAEGITAGVTTIKASHITELRARLDEARSALGLSPASYTDPTLTPGVTAIRAVHINELRAKTNEALTAGAGTVVDLRWLVSDQLGTPRMIFDQSGSLSTVSRHDYLPFGEELFAGTGGRTTAQGYSASDGVRQHFTLKERDNETGLDFFVNRYYSSTQGRFTSPDPFAFWTLDQKKLDEYISNPQRWNRYTYVLNNPLNKVDPDGLVDIPEWEKLKKDLQQDLSKRLGKDAAKTWNSWSNDQRQHVLNVRAALMERGVWNNITRIAYGNVGVDEHYFSRNETHFTPDNKGWNLALTSNQNIEWALKDAGFKGESAHWDHPEGRYTMKQPGDDIVLHMVMLNKPADEYATAHFDRGGGSIFNPEHFSDYWNGRNPSPDDVTRGLGKTPAAQYLRGVTPNIDKLLTQK